MYNRQKEQTNKQNKVKLQNKKTINKKTTAFCQLPNCVPFEIAYTIFSSPAMLQHGPLLSRGCLVFNIDMYCTKLCKFYMCMIAIIRWPSIS